DREVGVKPDACQTANAKREKSIIVFESSELALNSTATFVENAEAFRVARNIRVVPTAIPGRRSHSLVLRANRDYRVDAALLAEVVNVAVVVAAIHGACFRLVAASVESVKQRCNVVRFMVPRCFRAPRERQSGLRTNRKLKF